MFFTRFIGSTAVLLLTLLALFYSSWSFAILCCLLAGIAAFEYGKLLQKKGYRPLMPVLIGMTVLLVLWLGLDYKAMNGLFGLSGHDILLWWRFLSLFIVLCLGLLLLLRLIFVKKPLNTLLPALCMIAFIGIFYLGFIGGGIFFSGFGKAIFFLLIVLCLPLLVFLSTLARKKAADNFFWLLSGVVYLGTGWGCLLGLRSLDNITYIFSGYSIYAMDGVWFALLAFIIVWSTDVGAYLIGSAFGRHKLAPALSPKKSWEGAVGGVVLCLLAAFIYAVFIKNTYPRMGFEVLMILAFLVAPIASVLGQAGDLTESALKRWAGVKDSGSLIPGHGGVLDRFDSLMFVAPFLYIIYFIY
ncbi:MAG: phosphatidate cytidylyltransferase [Clostridiales bacterium]|nr:phosphatidate cytidylyltransferase [Clostridiales bacterium]